MRRREFIVGIGAAPMLVVWPFTADTQLPGIPVIGFLDTSSREAAQEIVSEFRRGLRDAGYIDGQNVAIEFRWGHGQPIMRQLASDLVRVRVAVIVASGAPPSQLAAKAATATIPIVIAGGIDPVKYGLVPSLSHPGGNITGMTYIMSALAAKRLDLLLKIAPEATTVGYLVGNQTNQLTQEETGELLKAAQSLGRQIIVVECREASDFEKAFATLSDRQGDAVVVGAYPLFFNNRNEIVALAARYKIPAIYAQPRYVIEGGLMSYTPAGVYHQVAIRYVARILNGAKPTNLPIQRPTNFSLAINLKTAKALGLQIPPVLFVQADRVIE
jgi:putative tryptophan/tyrosine transport system substrate-binding protein